MNHIITFIELLKTVVSLLISVITGSDPEKVGIEPCFRVCILLLFYYSLIYFIKNISIILIII